MGISFDRYYKEIKDRNSGALHVDVEGAFFEFPCVILLQVYAEKDLQKQSPYNDLQSHAISVIWSKQQSLITKAGNYEYLPDPSARHQRWR